MPVAIQAPLTARQREVYEFLVWRYRFGQSMPTVREIGAHFGIRSPNGVTCHLKALERKGYIERDRMLARGIRLKSLNGDCPCCGRAFLKDEAQ